MNIRYSPAAREDLRSLHRHLTDEFGAQVANRSVRKIITDISALKRNPGLLRPLEGKIHRPTNYWYLLCGRYSIAVSILDQKMISIVRILDGRTDYAHLIF